MSATKYYSYPPSVTIDSHRPPQPYSTHPWRKSRALMPDISWAPHIVYPFGRQQRTVFKKCPPKFLFEMLKRNCLKCMNGGKLRILSSSWWLKSVLEVEVLPSFYAWKRNQYRWLWKPRHLVLRSRFAVFLRLETKPISLTLKATSFRNDVDGMTSCRNVT